MARLVVHGNSQAKDPSKVRIRDVSRFEDLPDHEGIRHSHRGWGRSPVDHLAPLWRFFNSRVGKKWNDVYSEVCQWMNLNSFPGKHMSEHVEAIYSKQYSVSQWTTAGWSWGGVTLYVDAQGFLSRKLYVSTFRRKYGNQPAPPVTKIKEDGILYEKLDGIWYEVEYGKRVKTIPMGTDSCGNLIWRDFVINPDAMLKKRQLGKKELGKLGVKNDPPC
jgi:hypothetical protein